MRFGKKYLNNCKIYFKYNQIPKTHDKKSVTKYFSLFVKIIDVFSFYNFQQKSSNINTKSKSRIRPYRRNATFNFGVFCAFCIYFSSSSSNFVILFKLIAIVDALCKSAEVADGKMPIAPKTIRVPLNVIIKA